MQYRMILLTLFAMLVVAILPVTAGDIPTEYPVISQRFEGGEMIYLEENGDIFVLSSVSGSWWLFENEDYAGMPVNTDLNAPSERYAPVNGFGKIWANHDAIRTELGWAVLPEIGFDMAIRHTDTGNLYFTRLDGIRYHLRPRGTWHVLSATPENNESVIHQFTVTPDNVASGETITIQYETEGSDDVQLTIFSLDNPDYDADAIIELDNASGTLDWVIPEIVAGEVEITLNLIHNVIISGALVSSREIVESESIVIEVSQTVDFSNETYAVYQNYEQGFMIWREDTGGVHIFYENTHTWQVIPEHVYAGNSGYIETAPDGCIVPVNAFGKIWHSYFDIQVELGCAIGEETAYTLTITGDGTGQFNYALPSDDTITITNNHWN